MDFSPKDKKYEYERLQEFSYYPKDEAGKLENHILGESFNMDGNSLDKVRRQTKELENIREWKSKDNC